MAGTLDTSVQTVPPDLQIVAVPDTNKNYFNFTVTGLKISSNYAFQFQYVYPDGTVGDWSPGFTLSTPTESVPNAPSVTVPSTSTGSIPVTLTTFPTNTKRVDIYVIGGEFGTGKVVDYFLAAGTKSIAVSGGVYQVSLIAVTPSGINGDPTNTFTITVSTVGETVESPTNPNGFSVDRILGGIQVNWAGTYANGTFTGFEAIKIYVGTSATATSGTYHEAGVMTGNNVKNSITIPVDGTYLKYDTPVYIHAAAVNKNGDIGTIQQNVASNSLGARSAIATDLADAIITNAKLVDDAVNAAKIATSAITEVKIDTNAVTAAKIAAAAITETKIATDAVTSSKIIANAITSEKIDTGAITADKVSASAITADKISANAVTADKIVANAVTADKIVSSAITADKIATNAITSTKILAGSIDVTKLSAGTISVNNLEAGTISSTSYLRAGSKNIVAGTGARVEISSSLIEDGTVDIQPGFYIYNSQGTPILSAPLSGGLSIVGSGTFTGDISGASGTFTGPLTIGSNFSVTSTGYLTASSGTIGGWDINSTQLRSSGTNYISLNPLTPKIALVQGSTEKITIDPVEGIKDSAGNFTLKPDGTLTLKGSINSGSVITGAVIQASGSTYVKIDGVNYPGTLQLFAAGYATPGFIDVSGSWPTNEFTMGEISMSPPIATGHSAPKFLMRSDANGGYTLIQSDNVILGDSTSSTSGGRLDSGPSGWSIYGTTSSGIAINQMSLRNIQSFQGYGPPSGPSVANSQIGDIVLFYT